MQSIINEDAPSPLVLVVDDDDDIRDILSYGIEASGCRCLTAESGEAALRILKSEPVEVVISDVQMNGMSGLDLLEKIKTLYHEPPPVVMMITAYGDSENYSKAIKLGADDFLTKPVDFASLKEKIKTF